ncbi:hypothetical protein [Flavobacterium sp.]|uniref:hypothetical protein n=1 Tax=Flavobacterium sp. TaxID=239 RepID=UPI0039E35028
MKTIHVKDSRLYGLVALYDMHTDFYPKVLAGISDDAAQSRLDTQANHMAWLAGSMLQERFELAGWFGTKMEQTHHELFRGHQGIKDGKSYPPLADFVQDWKRISPVLREILLDLTADKVDSIFEMEGMKMTHFELLSFDTYREANIIGQLVLWRRLLGYPAMKYDE